MFSFGKDRLNEDLEKIRKSGLSPEARAKEIAREEEEKRKIKENLSEFTWKDVLAMSIAIIEIILPIILITAEAVAGLFLLIYWLGHQ